MEAGFEFVKTEFVDIIYKFGGLKANIAEVELKARHPDLNDAIIARAISEAVQESLIMRIEYQTPQTGIMINSFYLPQGSRIINW